MGYNRLTKCLVTVILCWTIRAYADDPLLALLDAQDEQQHALSHAISGTTAAAHSSRDFTSQLQQDSDPAELLASTDLLGLASQQLINTRPAANDLTEGFSPVNTGRRERQHQTGPPSAYASTNGLDPQTGSQLGVAALKHRIEELNRCVDQLLLPMRNP